MNDKKPTREDKRNCRIGHTTLSDDLIEKFCDKRECGECKYFLTEAEVGIN